jgi:hypothetical protein
MRPRWFRRVAYSRPTERGRSPRAISTRAYWRRRPRGAGRSHSDRRLWESELRAREVWEGLATHTTLAAACRAPHLTR